MASKAMTKKRNSTTESRQTRQKKAVLEHLSKGATVSAVCQKVGIDRSTYYRWLQKDSEFASKAHEAIDEGVDQVNDLAEAKLISNIQRGNQSSIRYWLDNNHHKYSKKGKGMSHKLTHAENNRLRELLFKSDNPRGGMDLLVRYSMEGKISEKLADTILKMLLNMNKMNEYDLKKKESEIMSEVLARKAEKKRK